MFPSLPVGGETTGGEVHPRTRLNPQVNIGGIDAPHFKGESFISAIGLVAENAAALFTNGGGQKLTVIAIPVIVQRIGAVPMY